MIHKSKCRLVLSTGEVLNGDQIGAPVVKSGELVFTTGLVGYTETLTDPSYFGQIIVFSYPLIGNYGVHSKPNSFDPLSFDGFESDKIRASGVIVSSDCPQPYHWDSIMSLNEYLKLEGIPGLVGADTRNLVQKIRAGRQILGRLEPESMQNSEKHFVDPNLKNILPEVSVSKRKTFGKGKKRIALVDCGTKWSLIRHLVKTQCEVELIPWDSDFIQVDCSGWLFSNGPGDPMQTDDLVARTKILLKQNRPVLGVCLGHQILALAAGARTEKLPFGHRSHNQPIVDLLTGRGYMTSQNHGYTVMGDTLEEDWKVWFKNLNDQTIEGIRHVSKPMRGVQFHPEANCGPHDTAWILDQFVEEVKNSAP